MPNKTVIDKEILYDLYITQNKSQADISLLLKCSSSKIFKALKKYQIKREQSKNLINLSGQKIKNWSVLGIDESRKTSTTYWTCQCDCGNILSINSQHLRKYVRNCLVCKKKNKEAIGVIYNPIEDITGQKINNWTVISKAENMKYKWLCKCDCGITAIVSHASLKNRKSNGCVACRTVNPQVIIPINTIINDFTVLDNIHINHTMYAICKCNSCGFIKKATVLTCRNNKIKKCIKCGKDNYYEDINSSWFNTFQKNAIKRNLEFNIKKEDVWNLYLKQNRKCALTNINIGFVKKYHVDRNYQTASIDRIDSNKGYTVDNIQIVHKKINFLKNAISQDDFIDLCNLVAQKHNKFIDAENFKYEDKCCYTKVKND